MAERKLDTQPSGLDAEQWAAFAYAVDVPMLVFRARRDSAGQLLDLVVADANAAALAAVDRTREQLLGQPLQEAIFVPAEHLAGFLHAVDDEHHAIRYPYLVEDPDGKTRSFDTVLVTFDGLLGLAWLDLSEIEDARRALSDSEARYRILAENSSDLVYELDLDERCVWISPSVEWMLGWSPADLLGTRMLQLLHPDDRARAFARRSAVFEHEVSDQIELRMRTADGSYRWMLGRGHPHRNAAGEITSGYVHVTDIHDLVLAREALAESEARYRRLAEGALDIVWQTDRDGLIQWVSPSVARELGWRPGEIVGRNTRDLVAADDHPAVLELRRRLYEEGRIVEGLELRLRHRDGRMRWMSARARPLRNTDGEVVAAIVALRDVDDAHLARDALAASEGRFRMLAEHASDVVYQIDADGVICWVSPSVERELGYRPEGLLGRQSLDLIHPDDRPLAIHARRERAADRTIESLEVRYLTSDGDARWMSVRAHGPEGDELDEGTFLVVALRDIDAEHRGREALAASEARFRLLAENASDVIVEFDRDQVCRWISPSVEWILGWRPDELVGDTLVPLAHPSEQTALLESWLRLFETRQPQEMQIRVRASDDTYRWILGRTRPHLDDDGNVVGAFSSFTDIDAEVRASNEYAHAARHDSLTGLANRAGLLDEIDRALASDRRAGTATAVLVIDLDHFKVVNDSLGHPVGDRLLSAASQRLHDCVRAGEFLARPGGDEFTVVIRNVDDPSSATQVAERIVDAFRTPFVFSDTELFTTASVGVVIAEAGDDAATPDTLLRDGDSALYHAKEHGRDRWSMFNTELREALEDRLRLERELRGALEADDFELYYQPEFDLTTGTLSGVEALLRWHHPSGELYPAARFIEVAEDTGLILQLGAWALRTACLQAADWALRYPERPIVTRFNISTLQLSESRLLEELDDVLRETSMPPGRLCVEITETALLRSTHVVSENLEGLRRRGLCLAFDEFGAGSSSLASLRDFPVDRLTLDREFVADITTDELDRNIVAGVLALAQRLSLPVTAGGVERIEQAELLAALGCQRAQGFLYAPALPAAQIDELLRGA